MKRVATKSKAAWFFAVPVAFAVIPAAVCLPMASSAAAQVVTSWTRTSDNRAGNIEKVFRLSVADSMPEIVKTLRTITDIAHLSSDQPRQTITAEGESKEVALAAWLISEFDQLSPSPGGHEYVMPDNADDLILVLRDIRIGMPTSAGHNAAPQDLDEIAGAFGSLCDLQRVIAYAPQGALVWRGKAWQADFALWLLREIADPPAVDWIEPTSLRLDEIMAPKVLDKDMPGAVRIFYFPPEVTPQNLGAIANAIRSRVHIQRVIVLVAERAIALRGTDEQATDAERIVEEARH